jgi:SulP family sulfate permease
MILASLSPDVEKQLSVSGILLQGGENLRLFPDIDHAIEWCEDKILYQDDLTMMAQASLESQLSAYFADSADLQTMMGYLDRQKVAADTYIIHRGDSPSGIYFVDRGLVRAELRHPDGETLRLRTMGEGTIVGELGAYLQQPAAADVITEQPSTLYYLSLSALARMEQDDPKVAAIFHKYLATILSKRLIDTNATVQALMD